MTQQDDTTYREVPLSKGKIALVDAEDYERVMQYSWYAQNQDDRWYGVNYKMQLLHRFIMNAPKGLDVDHKNRDGLDCRKQNLRLATRAQNLQNRRLSSHSTTGFKGVYKIAEKYRLKRPYWAYIKTDGKRLSLGAFATAEEAARAYDAAAREHFGEFARFNFPNTATNEPGALVPYIRVVPTPRSDPNANPRAKKLTYEKVTAIRDLLSKEWSVGRVSREFGVARATIRRIRDGLTWKT